MLRVILEGVAAGKPQRFHATVLPKAPLMVLHQAYGVVVMETCPTVLPDVSVHSVFLRFRCAPLLLRCCHAPTPPPQPITQAPRGRSNKKKRIHSALHGVLAHQTSLLIVCR